MSRDKTVFSCQNCGQTSPKWIGRCAVCGEWNTLVEEILAQPAGEIDQPLSEPILFEDVRDGAVERKTMHMDEFDRVLGGGLVAGSLVLIGGEPGIGKSTLLLQASKHLAEAGETVLYISGEESLEQIKLRGDRLSIGACPLFLLAETNLERILSRVEESPPSILILDSVQTIFSSKLTSSPGTISQVREVTSRIFRLAKSRAIPVFLIGHITKEGSLAGPKSLEHMVDVVLYFEGERDHGHRVLRVLKNRFGPVSELALFEMENSGLTVIDNPSAFFLKEKPNEEPGSVVVCTIKGSRPLLAEIQALVSTTLFSGNPRRMTLGLDHFRASMLLAIVEKKLGFSFAGEDVYLNIAGGLDISEPAADLGILVSVVSCLKNQVVPPNVCLLGEVGLNGEVRSVGQPLLRVKEAAAMGFETVILPRGNMIQLEKFQKSGIKISGVKHIKEAVEYLF
jgi:DNA repair protein RadA/Sms